MKEYLSIAIWSIVLVNFLTMPAFKGSLVGFIGVLITLLIIAITIGVNP